MQPDQVRENRNDDGGVHHGGVSKKALTREGCYHLRENSESRQNEDVDLWMSPDPYQVHIHHRVAAEVVCEEVSAYVTVERKKPEHGGQHRKRRYDQYIRAQRGPGEDWHLHH